MRLSAAATKIQPSIIRIMMRNAAELTAQGYNIIDATVGAPQHPVDPAAIDAAITELLKSRGSSPRGPLGGVIDTLYEHLAAQGLLTDAHRKGGPVPYTDFQGDPEARERIAGVRSVQFGEKITGANVLLGVGVNGTFDLVIRTITEVGESVITTAPYFLLYKPMIEQAGRTFVTLQTTAEQGFKLSPERLREHLESLREPEGGNDTVSATFLLNSPNNPTGSAYSQAELRGLLAVLDDFPGVNIIDDGIYREITYGNATSKPLLGIAGGEIRNRIISLESASKEDALPGMRIGDVCCLDATVMSKMAAFQLNANVHPTREAQMAYAAALEGRYRTSDDQPTARVEVVRKHYAARAAVVADRGKAGGYMPQSYQPEGAFYALLDLEFLRGQRMSEQTAKMVGKNTDDPITNDIEAAGDLMSRFGVVTTPARGFGTDPKKIEVRLVYTDTPDRLHELFDRLDRYKAITEGRSQEILPTQPPRKPGPGMVAGETIPTRAAGPAR